MTLSNLHQGCTVGDLIVRSIQCYRDRPALVGRDRTLSYAQMGQLIGQFIHLFKSQGLRRGDGLAQLAGNRAEAACVTLASIIMGLRYTPLHPLGSVDDHIFILNDAQVSAVVVDSVKFAGRCEAFKAQVPGMTHQFAFREEALATNLIAFTDDAEMKPVVVEADARDIAWIAYTGGTTGKPKGVVLPHRSLVTNILMALSEWEWPEEIRFLAVTPVSHASGIIMSSVLQRGGTFYLLDGFTPEEFLETVQRHRITTTFLVPTMIYALLDHKGLRDQDLSSLETVVYGAAAISPTRLVEALETIGPVFMQLFGQTEAPNTICTLKRREHDLTRQGRLASCGRPMAGLQVKLLDDEGRETAMGEPGEICVRGPLVMDGYWRREAETAAALEGGWLHTGDIATRDEEGFIYIVDRKKDMIISGGFNIFPREIEDVLSAHKKISAVSVFGVPDEKWGERVVAAIVVRPKERLDEVEVKALVKEKKGAIYSPKDVHFVETLPVTALGKPDKKLLRTMFGG